MNKKITTLAAGLALVSAVGVSAQVIESPAASKYTAGRYYHLVNGDATKALAVIPSKSGADSLVVRDLANASVFPVAEDQYDVANALWLVTVTKSEANGNTYKFVNKATGNVLTLKPGVTEYAWVKAFGEANTNHATLRHETQKLWLSYGQHTQVDEQGNKVNSVYTGSDSSNAMDLYLFAAADEKLSAQQLNDFNGDSFTLQMKESLAHTDFAPFFSKAGLQAVVATGLDQSVKGPVYLRALGATKAAKDGVANPYVYLTADTTVWSYSSIKPFTGTDGVGYKITTDTVASERANANAIDLVQEFARPTIPAAGRGTSLEPYQFTFFINPSVEGMGQIKIQMNTLVKAGSKTDNSYYKNATVSATEDYVAIADLGGKDVNYLMSSNKVNAGNVTLPTITFAEGSAANLDTEVAYFISDARASMKQVSSDDNVRYIANKYAGKYYYVDCDGNKVVKKTYKVGATSGAVVFAYTDGAKSELLPSTQWVAVGKDGRYSFYNRESGANFSAKKNVYDLGNGIYAIGKDTVRLEKVAATGKHIGSAYYNNVDVANMAFGLGVVDPNAPTKIISPADDKGNVQVGLGSVAEGTAQMFKLVPLTYSYKLAESLDADSLEYHVYLLQERYGDKYLYVGGKSSKLVSKKSEATAVRFKNTAKEGEYVVELFDNVRDAYFNNEDGSGITIAAYEALPKEEKAKYTKYSVADALNEKLSASTTSKDLSWVEICRDASTNFNDLFTIQNTPKPEYAKIGEGHKLISTVEDDTKAITMFTDGFAALKGASQEMGDTIVTENNLGLWLTEANVEDETMPLYYITTARGISAEDQEAGYKYFMVSLKDSANAEYVGKVRLGFVKAVALGDSAIAVTSSKDTIAMDVNPAAFAFQTTTVDGAYKLEIPGLTQILGVDEDNDGETDKDEWGNDKTIVVPATNRFVAVKNNVLYLTNSDEAYQFTVTPTELAPTANESVEDAVAAVKVTTGNGTVTVQGAAGKKVVITNVLGKVIASTVLTSDNATFNVPAGIVAVAVEGEEAVKAVVK